MTQSIPGRKFELLLRRVGDLPALPDVVNTIVDKLGRPEIPASEIAKLISYDPGLTSKFLRIVNSAAYGFQRQISSVQHAIMILGFNMVRGVVLSASIFKLLESKHHGLDPTEFWKHSIATAIGSRIIASHYKVRYAEDAFSAGMLHDIGKMIMDYYFADDYKEVLHKAKQIGTHPHGLAFQSCENAVLEIDHTEMGYRLAMRWKLPATFCEVIRYHHAPENAHDAPELVYAVSLANEFSKMAHYNAKVFNPEWIPQSLLEYYLVDLENTRPLEILFKQVCEEMDSIEELLTTLKF